MSVFVISKSGKPLMPCKPSKARKLLKFGAAKPVWSKFGTFGIQLLTETSRGVQTISLGYDPGTKFEGFSIASVRENVANIKLNLPDKKKIKDKLEERKTLRRSRRQRKTRYRKSRFENRHKLGFIAPSQKVIVDSRLKILKELFRIYPISVCGIEDVRFNHAKKRWGKNFSTCEIGKSKLYRFVEERAKLYKFQGFETKELRTKYGYKKTSNKASDRFESHCCDSLSLAIEVNGCLMLEPSNPIVVDDTYRPVRRKLHDTVTARNGIRLDYSKGTVFNLKKGKVVFYKNRKYLLTGYYKTKYRITDIFSSSKDKRKQVGTFDFISKGFLVKD